MGRYYIQVGCCKIFGIKMESCKNINPKVRSNHSIQDQFSSVHSGI